MNPAIELTIAQWKTALTGLGKVVSKRASLPVLASIRAHRQAGQLALQTTDLDRTLTHHPDAAGPEAPFLIPFEPLQQAVKVADRDGTLRVGSASDAAVTIEFPVAGQVIRQRHESPALSEWPELPVVSAPADPVADSFKSALSQALACSSRDDSRHVIQGACLDVTDKGDYIVGTDGRHLYAANSFRFPHREPVIIPAHKFLQWKGFAEDGEWQLAVQSGKEATDPTHIRLQSPHWTCTTKAIEGPYPNWRQVLPNPEDSRVVTLAPAAVAWLESTLPKLPLNCAVTKSLLFAVSGGQLRVQSGVGEVDLVVPGAEVLGDDVVIGLNRDYVLKALKFGFNAVNISGPLDPILFTSPGRTMIIMPVRGTSSPSTAATQRQAEPASTNAATQLPQLHPESDEDEPVPVNRVHTTTNNERKPMSATPTQPQAAKAVTQSPVEMVEDLRNRVRELNGALGEVLRALKDAAKEQRTTEREVNTIRNRLRSLQSVEI
jgi:DNA polymerase III sliding clamp (beta) subunit (PCNA family)